MKKRTRTEKKPAVRSRRPRARPKRPARAKSKLLTPIAVTPSVPPESEPEPEATPVPARRPSNRIEQLRDSLLELVSDIPNSSEPSSATPAARARLLVLHASSKAAVISGTLALPPGLIGLLTILPELQLIWRTQAQLVADIAAVYGKSYQLRQQQMIFCLFRHVASQLVRDVVVRAGERFLVRRTKLRMVQQLLQRIGVKVAQRSAGSALSRLVPVVGAVGIGGYAFYDTTQVGKTAIALFESEIVDEGPEQPRGDA
jgi:hypothetical protein